MTEIISVGDFLKHGEYNLHSCFENAVNFVLENKTQSHFACIVKEKVGSGPINILIKGLNFERVQSLVIFKNKIIIDNIEYKISEDLKYDSKIHLNEIDKIHLNKNLKVNHKNNWKIRLEKFKEILLENAPDESLAYLIDDGKDISENKLIGMRNHGAKNFSREMKRRFRDFVKAAFAGGGIEDINTRALNKLRGLGLGFTPAGDDFICGALYGLNIIEMISGKSFSVLKHKIYKNSRNKNPITNAFKQCAFRGLFFGKLKDFCVKFLSRKQNSVDYFDCDLEIKDIELNGNKIGLKILNKEKDYDFKKELIEVLKTGETSGADLCAGLYFILRLRGGKTKDEGRGMKDEEG